jgi:hypothetical protein
MLAEPVPAQPIAPQPDTIKPVKKVPGKVVTVPLRRSKPAVADKAQAKASQSK